MDELSEEVVGRLDVDVSFDGDLLVIAVNGELDLTTAGVLEEVLGSTAGRDGSGVVFDMSGVEFMDSSGIAVLIRAAAQEGFVELRRPSTVVRLVIEATGLTDVLRMAP